MRLLIIIFFLNFSHTNAQKTEKIVFKSANPFALSDIITDLENQQEQEVYGKLTFPHDSLEKEEKFPNQPGSEKNLSQGYLFPILIRISF